MKFNKLLGSFIFSFIVIMPTIQLGKTESYESDEYAQQKPFAYGYFYTNKEPMTRGIASSSLALENAQSLMVGQNVTFGYQGPIIGIQHKIGSSEITFENDGIYVINFLTVSNGNGPIFELFLNNNLVEGNPFGVFGNQLLNKSGQSIIEVQAGDKLSLRLNFVSSEQKSVYLHASLTIVQIA